MNPNNEIMTDDVRIWQRGGFAAEPRYRSIRLGSTHIIAAHLKQAGAVAILETKGGMLNFSPDWHYAP
jgi:hypothetical protein